MIEVKLRYGQQDSGKRQVWAEPTEECFNAREGSVDQRWVFYTHTVQYTHGLHQALKEETTLEHQYKPWSPVSAGIKTVCILLFSTKMNFFLVLSHWLYKHPELYLFIYCFKMFPVSHC